MNSNCDTNPYNALHNLKHFLDSQIHVLIIDEDAEVRRIFGGWLAKMGIEVLYAKNGDEGREMARRHQPNLILVDFNLPIMDGFEVSRRVKEENITRHIPIIMLTNADLSFEVQLKLEELGVDDYIHKGEDFDAFCEHIHKALASVNK